MAERVWDADGAFRCKEDRSGREAREAGCMKWLGIEESGRTWIKRMVQPSDRTPAGGFPEIK